MIANNLAIYTLSDALQFNENVQSIAVPSQNFSSKGSSNYIKIQVFSNKHYIMCSCIPKERFDYFIQE
jgi:hypothetical protein